GEPTFTSRFEPSLPEWNGAAMGASKDARGRALADELRRRLAPGAAMQHRMGKHYPGESLPRWAIEIIGKTDGTPLWPDVDLGDGGPDAAERIARAVAARLGVPATLHAAYEDPWQVVRDESQLPVAIDPRAAGLDDPEERRRLARILDRGVGAPVGWVLPLARNARGDQWLTETWRFRRDHLFLLPGDSPIGLRLPLGSLGPGQPPPVPEEEP